MSDTHGGGGPATPADSSRDRGRLDIELELPDLDALFRPPDLSPMDPRFRSYSYESGLEYLAYRLYADRRIKWVNATLVLPSSAISEASKAEVAAAIQRFSDARIEAAGIEVRADAVRGRRAFGIGLGLLVVLLLLAQWVDSVGDGGFAAEALATGLQIGAWVSLWFPLEKLLWGAWTHRSDRLVYERLGGMEFRLLPAADPD